MSFLGFKRKEKISPKSDPTDINRDGPELNPSLTKNTAQGKSYVTDQDADLPYLPFDADAGDLRLSNLEWRLGREFRLSCMMWLTFTLLFAAGAVFMTGLYKHKVVPYVITVDRQGVIIGRGELAEESRIPEPALAAALGDFIGKLRLISYDTVLQHHAIREVFAHLKPNSGSYREINEFYRRHDPLNDPAYVRHVELTNVIRLSPKSFQLDWDEIIRHDDGKSELYCKRAIVSYSLVSVINFKREEMELNPLGIMIDQLTISDVAVTSRISRPQAQEISS